MTNRTVPLEPTEEMIQAIIHALDGVNLSKMSRHERARYKAIARHKAMCAVASQQVHAAHDSGGQTLCKSDSNESPAVEHCHAAAPNAVEQTPVSARAGTKREQLENPNDEPAGNTSAPAPTAASLIAELNKLSGVEGTADAWVAPAADPVQMRHGRWNLADDGFGMQSADDGVYCYYADAQERVREFREADAVEQTPAGETPRTSALAKKHSDALEPTPECDVCEPLADNYYELFQHSSQLERDLAASQEQIAKLTTDLMGQRGDYDELVKRYFIIETEGTLLIKERDKAQERVKELEGNFDKVVPLLNDFSQQVDDQRQRAEKAEAALIARQNELSAANAEVGKLNTWLSLAWKRAEEFEQERDALAKDAERLQRERDRAVEQQAIQIEGRDSAWHYIFKLRTKIILLQAQLDQRSGRDAT